MPSVVSTHEPNPVMRGPDLGAIVRATDADLDDLVPLVREYYAFDGIPFHEESIRRGLGQLLRDEALGVAWLIQHAGKPAGYSVLTFGFDLELGGRQATVTDLYLRPDARRRALGTAAIATIEAFLTARGISAYELQVERANHRARTFYERLGFRTHDRVPLTKRITPNEAVEGPESEAP